MNVTNKKKEFLNIGTIGHIDHGKTTLTSAISKRIAERFGGKSYSYDEIDNSKEEKERGITINQTTIKYETDKRLYSHVDCPGHKEFVKNMIVGATGLDAAIVVVSLTDGPMLQTTEHLLLIKRLGIEHVIVFLNKEDLLENNPDKEEQIEIVRYHMIDILTSFKFNLDLISFVIGSGYQALNGNSVYIQKLDELIDRMEQLPLPDRRVNEKLILPIDGIKNIVGRGKVAVGIIEQGTIAVGQTVDVIGYDNDILKNKVVSIEMFRSSQEKAEVGQNVGVLLRNTDNLSKGQIICEPGLLKSSKSFKGELYALTKSEGGRSSPFGQGSKYSPQFFFVTADITGRIILEGDVQSIFPGDTVSICVNLIKKIAMYIGQNVIIREGGKTIATMKITEVLNS